MAVDNENADPVGTPISEAVRKAGRAVVGAPLPAATDLLPDPPPKPRDLHQEQQDFTAEGSPPPGKVGHTEPAAGDGTQEPAGG